MQKRTKKPPKPKFDPDAEHVLLGYARVSTLDQNPHLQIDALRAYGVPEDKIYYDQKSGAADDREQFNLLMMDARENDIVVVWKLDRLGRSTLQLLKTVAELDAKGARLKVLMDPLYDTTTPTGRFVVTIMAALAEMERSFIRERTIAGLAAARARGRFGGRASYATDEQVLATKHMRPTQAQKRLGYKTLPAYLRRLAVAEKNAAAAAQPKQETADAEPQA